MIGLTTIAAFVAGAGLTGISAYALSQREAQEPELKIDGPSAVGAGDTVTYTAEYGGEGATRFEWQVGDEVRKFGSDNQLEVTMDEDMDNTRITVHAYNTLSATHLGWDMKQVSVWSEE